LVRRFQIARGVEGHDAPAGDDGAQGRQLRPVDFLRKRAY